MSINALVKLHTFDIYITYIRGVCVWLSRNANHRNERFYDVSVIIGSDNVLSHIQRPLVHHRWLDLSEWTHLNEILCEITTHTDFITFSLIKVTTLVSLTLIVRPHFHVLCSVCSVVITAHVRVSTQLPSALVDRRMFGNNVMHASFYTQN